MAPTWGVPGTVVANTSRMDADGSDPTTAARRATSSLVSLPVPEATSRTRLPGTMPSLSTRWSTTSPV